MTEPADREEIVTPIRWVGEQGLQIVVPVGMRDLLDDWVWSPDAARWDPGLAMRVDSVRLTPSSPDFAYFTAAIDTRALEAAMAAVRESMSRMVDSFRRVKLGGASTLEIFDETLPSGPPSDVRGRALWLRQHRNIGPERPRGSWYVQ